MLKITSLNPFRILSLPGNSDLKELKKLLSSAKKKLKVGIPLDVSLPELFSNVDPSRALEELDSAVSDPVRRSAFRVLWPSRIGAVPVVDSLGAWSKATKHDEFLRHWYQFEAGESDEALLNCLTLWRDVQRAGRFRGGLIKLLCEEEGIGPSAAETTADEGLELALDELSLHVVEVAERKGDFELIEFLLDKPFLDSAQGTWLECLIKIGTGLSNRLAKTEASLEICDIEEQLEAITRLVSPLSSRAELWSRTLREHHGAREVMVKFKELEEDLKALPGDENDGALLREIVRLSTLRHFRDDPEIQQGWSDAVALLVKVKTEFLRPWLEILKTRVKGFSKENPELISLLEGHLKASEEGQRVLKAESCSRAVKVAAAVCLDLAHRVGEPTQEDREGLMKAFELVSAADRQIVQSDLKGLRDKYPNFFAANEKFWADLWRAAGSLYNPSERMSVLASERVLDITKPSSGSSNDGCSGCIGLLIAFFFLWVVGGTCAPSGSGGGQRSTSSTTSSRRAKVERHELLVGSLEKQDKALVSDESVIKDISTMLDTDAKEIEQARPLVDPTNQLSVDQFNAQVDEYNANNKYLEDKRLAYNKAVDERNATLSEIKALEQEINGK